MPYFDDDGNELFPDLLPLPLLCLFCRQNLEGDSMDRVLCNLTRIDQRDEAEFFCGAYEPGGVQTPDGNRRGPGDGE